MSVTYVEGADSRQNLGFSGIIQANNLSFTASDYTTGGYTINPANWGLGHIHGMWTIAQAGTNLATTVEPRYNKTTGKLQMFGSGGGSGLALAEVANGFDLSPYTFSIIAYGF